MSPNPSFTLPAVASYGGASRLTHGSDNSSLTLNRRGWSSTGRSYDALLTYALSGLKHLAARQPATDRRYAILLRLIGALIRDGSATPQVGSNGEGGVMIEWLVGSRSLTIDFEDETEILITASTQTDGVIFSEPVNSWWTPADPTIQRARQFLAEISVGAVRPLSLA